ncbi:hypothetical protein GCM10009749_24900 [Agromyces neolithicus]|uniref:PD-(D/E)XK motif protein n=2 Tax=Agromyces neolithicus TaxID=269420 RepID=A0ABN2M8N3_9MICO
MKTERTFALWNEMLQSGEPQHRLIRDHPLHLYFGVESDGLPVFFLVSDVQPEPPKIEGLVKTQVRRRDDQKWVAVVALTDAAYADAFIGMCLELARRTSGTNGEDDGVGLFDATLTHWQKMLSQLSMRTLSREQMRGLFGELTFGVHLARQTSLAEMIHAWDGPMGAAQDFRHPTLGNYEVKSIGLDGRRVKISSVAQLDPTPNAKVDLIVAQIDEDPLGMSPDGTTLAELIRSIRSELLSATDLLEEFDNRIAAVGIDTSDARYEEVRFVCAGIRAYRTGDSFPRLRAAAVVAGVENVRYEIQLTALEPFALSIENALAPDSPAGIGEGAIND